MTLKDLYDYIIPGDISFFFDQQFISKNVAGQKINKKADSGLVIKEIKPIEHRALVLPENEVYNTRIV